MEVNGNKNDFMEMGAKRNIKSYSCTPPAETANDECQIHYIICKSQIISCDNANNSTT